MRKTSLGFIALAIIFVTASAHAQSATPTEGNPPAVRPAPLAPGTTTGATPRSTAPNSAAPINPAGSSHMPGGNPDRAPASSQTHEPPAK
jgi:hypothetical protein